MLPTGARHSRRRTSIVGNASRQAVSLRPLPLVQLACARAHQSPCAPVTRLQACTPSEGRGSAVFPHKQLLQVTF